VKQVRSLGVLSLALLLCSFPGHAQQTSTGGQPVGTIVPPLVNFSGVLTDGNGKPLTGVVGVTFYLYKDSQGGSPLWMETQNVQLEKTGHYKVMLGSATAQGVPAELFASGEARWLGVQAQGQEEQPRVLLLSVPYALKALDAETLGGKPASAFVAASTSASSTSSVAPGLSGGGKTNYIARWLSSTKLGISNIFETIAGNVGIGTTTPAANLDVKGTGDIRGTLTLFPSENSPTLSVNGTAFSVSNSGLVNFISGQTFPGTGTITGVSAGTDLTGGGTSGSVTLNLDTTKVPQLNAANTFTGNQTVNGNIADTGNVGVTGNISSGGSISATGTGLGVFMGNVGCPAPTIGIQAANLSANCQNFIVGFDSSQNSTYINRPTGGTLHFREGNGADQMVLAPGGAFTVGAGFVVQPTTDSNGNTTVNITGGYVGNRVASGFGGQTIGGGGQYGSPITVTADYGTVGGGDGNTAGFASTVAGGENNVAGNTGTVGAGQGNTATGLASTVAGGWANVATGAYSFAAGHNAVASDVGSFVWCALNSYSYPCNSSGTNSFEVSVDGPIIFYDGPNGSGCNLTAGGGSCNCSSDRNLKDNIVPIDSRSVLERVAHLPITQWKMKAEPAGRKHIGPMAQDFYVAFGLGDSDRYIALGDGQGVALAAIQALYGVVQEKNNQIRKLTQQLEVVRAKEGQLKKQIQDLHHAQSQKITSLEERMTRLEVQDRIARTAQIATEAHRKQRSSQPGGGI